LTFLKKEIVTNDESRSLSAYEDRIISEKPGDKYAFDISGCKCCVLVGQQIYTNKIKRELHMLTPPHAEDSPILERLDRIMAVIADVHENQKMFNGRTERIEESIREIKESGMLS
jgi:hypothetical protein